MKIGRNKIKRSCEVKMEKFGFYSESNEKLLEGFKKRSLRASPWLKAL